MKFFTFKTIKGENFIEYLTKDLAQNFKELNAGLHKRLNYSDNFDSEIIGPVTIASGAVGQFFHNLGQVPNEWAIYSEGEGNIAKDTTIAWTNKKAFFKNYGSNAATIRVRFFK